MKSIKDTAKYFYVGWLATVLLMPATSWAADHGDLQKKAYFAMATADSKRDQGSINDAALHYKAAALHYQELLERGSDLKPELIQYLITYCEGQRLQLQDGVKAQSISTSGLLEKKLSESRQEAARIESLLEATKQQDDLMKAYEKEVEDLTWVVSKSEETVAQHKQDSQSSRELLTQQVTDHAKERKEWASLEKHYKQRLKKEDEKLALAQKEIQNLRWINTKADEKAYKYLAESQATRELLTQKNKEHAAKIAGVKRLAAEQAVDVKQEGKKLLKMNAEVTDLQYKLAKVEESRIRAEQSAAEQTKYISALQATAYQLQEEKKALVLRVEEDIKALQDRLAEVSNDREAQKQTTSKGYADLSNRLEKRNAEFTALLNEKKQIEGKLNTLEDSISRQLKEKDSQHAKALENQQGIQKDLSKKQGQAVAELQRAQSEQARIAADNKQLKESYRQVQEHLDTAEKSHKKERSDLQAAIKNLKAHLADKSQQKALEGKEVALEKATAHAEELQQKLAQAQQKIDTQEEQIAAERTKGEKIAKNLKQAFMDKEKGMLARLKKKDTQLAKSTKELTGVKQELIQAQTAITGLNETIAGTQKEASERLDREKALLASLKEKDAQLAKSHKELAGVKQEYIQAQTAITGLKETIAQTQEEASNRLDNKKALLASLKEKDAQLAKSHKELAGVKQEYIQAQTAITGLNETIAQTQKEASDRLDKEKAVLASLKEKDARLAKSHKELSGVKQEFSQALTAITGLKETIARTQKEASDRLDKEKASQHQQVEELENKIRNYKQMETDLKNSNNAYAKLLDRLSELEKELSTTKMTAAKDTEAADMAHSILLAKQKEKETERDAREKQLELSIKEQAANFSKNMKEMKEVQKQYDAIREEHLALKKDSSDAQQQAESKLEQLSTEIKSARAESKDRVAALKDAQAALGKVQAQYETAQTKAESLQAQLNEADQKLSNVKQAATQQLKDESMARAQLSAKVKEQAVTMVEIAERIEDQNKMLEQKKHWADGKGGSEIAALKKSVAQIEALQEKIAATENQLESVLKKGAANKTALEEALKESNSKLALQKKQYTHSLKEKDSQWAKDLERIKSLEKQLEQSKQVQAGLDALKADKADTDQQLDEMRTQVASLEKSSKRQAEEAQSTIQSLQKQVEKSKRDKAELVKLKVEKGNTDKQLNDLRPQLATLEKHVEQSNRDKAELGKLKAEKEGVKKQVNTLRSQLESIEKSSSRQAEEAQSTIQSLQKQVEKTKRDKSALETLKTEQEKAEKQLKSLHSQLASMEKTNVRQTEEAHSAIEELKQQLLELNNDNTTLLKKSEERAKQLKEQARKIPKLEKTVKTQASKINKLSSKAASKSPKVDPGTEKIEAAVQKKLKALEAENVLLKNNLQKMKIQTLKESNKAAPGPKAPANVGP